MTLDWLLDGDPAIRWQVLRDLADAPDDVIRAERARVATEGWGARLLAARDPDGQWAGGAYFPADAEPPPEGDPSQPWTATTPSLALLRAFGIDPDTPVMRETIALVRDNCTWEEGDQPYFAGEVEPCINGTAVAIGAYFGQNVDGIVERLLADRLPDGGWNCWAQDGAKVSSFASTINVLEGLLEYERATGKSTAAQRRQAEEYLLERHLFRRKSTGQPADPAFLQFSYPPRWHYDILRALEYFRAVGGPPDERLAEAVELVRAKQQPDGTWLLENTHPGAVHFDLEDGDGRPSRWNTLRALRVLRYADT